MAPRAAFGQRAGSVLQCPVILVLVLTVRLRGVPPCIHGYLGREEVRWGLGPGDPQEQEMGKSC